LLFQIFGMGSNTNVEFINDISAPASGNAISFQGNLHFITAEKGIRFLCTGDITGDSSIAITATAAGAAINVIAEDWEDSILVQSDRDVILQTFASGMGIHQTTYNHRLSFFDAPGDFINIVNGNGLDVCLRAGWCSFGPGNGGTFATNGVNSINAAASALQTILIDFGLIEWHNLPNAVTYVP